PALGNRVDGHETDVVSVAGVARTGIAEPDEEQHGVASVRSRPRERTSSNLGPTRSHPSRPVTTGSPARAGNDRSDAVISSPRPPASSPPPARRQQEHLLRPERLRAQPPPARRRPLLREQRRPPRRRRQPRQQPRQLRPPPSSLPRSRTAARS